MSKVVTVDYNSLESGVVYTGDTILLRVRTPTGDPGYLSCDGITATTLNVIIIEKIEDCDDIRDCLFKVIYKLDYTARKDLARILEEQKQLRLQEAAEKKKQEGPGTKDVHIEQTLEILEKKILLLEKDLKSARDKVAKENENNDEKKLIVEPIAYGDNIQLLHEKSGKYITVSPKNSAIVEKENRQCNVGTGDQYSLLKVHSFYKHKFHGEKVRYEEQIVMQSNKLGKQWHLHTAATANAQPPSAVYAQPVTYEFNCSCDTVNGFFPVLYSRNPENLNLANVVRLFYCQTAAFLGASARGASNAKTLLLQNVDELKALRAAVGNDGKVIKEYKQRGKTIPPGAVLDASDAAKFQSPTFPCDISFTWSPPVKPPYLRKTRHDSYDHTDNLWSKGCWLIEAAQERFRGGAVHWKEMFCLRHLGSGRYLGVDNVNPTKDKAGSLILKAVMKSKPDVSCYFSLDPIEPVEDGAPVSSGRVRALLSWKSQKGNEFWLSGGAPKAHKKQDAERNPSCDILFINMRRVRDAIQLDCMDNMGRKQGNVIVSPVAQTYLTDINFVYGVKQFFKSSCKKIVLLRSQLKANYKIFMDAKQKSTDSGVLQDSMQAAEAQLDYIAIAEDEKETYLKIKNVLNSSVKFLMTHGRESAGEPGDQFSADKAANDPKPCNLFRQRIAKELKFIDASVDLQEAIWIPGGCRHMKKVSRCNVNLNLELQKQGSFASNASFGTSSRRTSSLLAKVGSVSAAAAAESGKDLSDFPSPEKIVCMKFVLVLWKKCFEGDRVIESYFVKSGWIELINSLNGLGLGAAAVLGCLVNDNLQLVQGIEPHVILQFVNFLKTLGPDETWLMLLKTFCSCQGQAISKKQQQVLEAVYFPGSIKPNPQWVGNKEKLLMSIRLGTKGAHQFPSKLREFLSSQRNHILASQLLFETGIKDIYVWWHSQEEVMWQLGDTEKFGLYFSPKRLGLKTTTFPDTGKKLWVNLVDIAWVLEPLACYPKLFGEPWKAKEKRMPKKEKAQIDALLVLAKFLKMQIQLYSEMCLHRQENAVQGLEKEFVYELMVCGMWHPLLPETIRSQFAALTDNLWIDRHPHFELNIPGYIRKYNTLGSMQNDGLPKFTLFPGQVDSAVAASKGPLKDFYSIASPDKFQLLSAYIQFHVEKMQGKMCHSQSTLTAYTGSLMEMLLHLIRFGFLSRVEQLYDLMGPILLCMDGRTDWLDTNVPEGQLTPRSNFVVNVGGTPTSELQDQSPSSQSSVTTAPNSLKDQAKPLLGDKGSSGGSWFSKKPAEKKNGPAKRSIHLAPIPNDRLYPPVSSGDDDMRRYANVPQNNEMMLTKTYMCQLCSSVTDLMLDQFMGKLVPIFRNYEDALSGGRKGYTGAQFMNAAMLDSRGKINPPQICQDVLACINDTKFNFNEVLEGDFIVLLFDLLMYDNVKLFETAIELLFKVGFSTDLAMRCASDLFLILNDNEQENVNAMHKDIIALTDGFQTFETWGVNDCFSVADVKRSKLMIDICVRLRYSCSLGGQEAGDTNAANETAQRNLLDLGIMRAFLAAVTIPIDEFEGESRETLKSLMKEISSLITMFVFDNKRNQNAMFKHLDALRTWFNYGVGMANAIGAIFKNNRELCEKVPKSLVYDFALALQGRSRGFLPHQLSFFLSILVVGERKINRNADILAELLSKPRFDQVLHCMFDKAGRQRRLELIANFKSFDQLKKPEPFRKWLGNDAELMYCNKSIELCALICIGMDTGGGSSLVVHMITPDQLTLQYIEIDEAMAEMESIGSTTAIKKKSPGMDKVQAAPVKLTRDAIEMARVVRGSMVDLLHNCYYHTERKDQRFWNSDIHAALIQMQVEEMNSLFHKTVPIVGTEEVFIHRVLRALNAYLEFGMASTEKDKNTNPIIREFVHVPLMECMEYAMANVDVPQKKEVFRVEVKRLIAWIQNDDSKNQLRIPGGTVGDYQSVKSNGVMQTRTRYKSFVTSIKDSPQLQGAIKEESDSVVRTLLKLASYTDPAVPEFQARKRESIATGCGLGMDYRRNKLMLDDVVHRFVDHAMSTMGETGSWPALGRIYDLLNRVIDYCNDESNPDSIPLEECQTIFCQAGVVRLVIETLMMKPDFTLSQQALTLGISMLKPSNRQVQKTFVLAFLDIDDSGLWQVFADIYDQVGANMKNIRVLKEVQRRFEAQRELLLKESPDLDLTEEEDSVLTLEEQEYVTMFSNDLQNCCKAMEFLQKLAEGHNSTMQDYTFFQLDNAVSINFVEKTVDMILRIMKNQESADGLDAEELELLMQATDLIIELLQGPCARNQQYCSVSGLVEQINKILRWRCENIVENANGDPYPEEVRALKQKLCLCLNCMIELRKDTEVHKNILHRCDVNTFKDRVIYVHRYFLSHILKLGSVNLADLTAPDAVKVPNMSPELVVEPYRNDTLQDWFGEAWELLMLMNQLAEVDDDFKHKCRPNKEEVYRVFGAHDFATDADRKKALAQQVYSRKYYEAVVFFSRWLKSIEIVLDNKLYEVWFRMPVICDFVLGSAKRDIGNKISIASPEEKAQEFIEMSLAIFEQTEHTRFLANWEWPFSCILPYACRRPFNFFLKNDAQNLMRIAEYSLYVAVVINMFLYEYMFLEDGDEGSADHPKYPILHADGYDVVVGVGWFYFVCMVITLVITVFLYSPLDYRHFKKATQLPDDAGPLAYVMSIRPIETVVALSSIGGTIWVCNFYYEHHWIVALMGSLILCNIWSSCWKDDSDSHHNRRAPNNWWAWQIQTLDAALQRPPITRRAVLALLCWLGLMDAWYFFSFLLLDTMFQYPMLENVLKAVTKPYKALGLTFLLGMIIMYAYAFVGFYYFRPDFDGACTNIADCTVSTIYKGMREDIGSALSEVSPSVTNWYERVVYDLSYFVIITTVLMNVIFGIILDTFGSLRDETSEREEYMRATCFISCLERSEIEKATNTLENPEIKNGYKYIEEIKQNKWNYLNYIFYLFRKEETEYSGPESYVSAQLKDGDIAWIPLKKCRLIEAAELKLRQAEESK